MCQNGELWMCLVYIVCGVLVLEILNCYFLFLALRKKIHINLNIKFYANRIKLIWRRVLLCARIMFP
jgi:hypothetical protein